MTRKGQSAADIVAETIGQAISICSDSTFLDEEPRKMIKAIKHDGNHIDIEV